MTLPAHTIYERLLASFGDKTIVGFEAAAPREAKDGPRDAIVHVRAADIVPVGTALATDPELRFDFLQNLTAVDWPARDHIDIVYHLFSYQHRHELVVKTNVPRAEARLPSVTAVGAWKNADWLEREQYDLFGVLFDGHPDLRRLLLPDDWVGHPMRKDYREAAEYRGMPTSRPSAMDLLLEHDRAHQSGTPTMIPPKGGTT